MKFLIKPGHSGSEIMEMSEQIYRDNAMMKTLVYKWVKQFSEAQENVTDDKRWATVNKQ